MRNLLYVAVPASLLLGATLFVLWADGGQLPDDQLVRKSTYSDTSPTVGSRDTFTVVTYNLAHLSKSSPGSQGGPPSRLHQALSLLQSTNADFVGLQEIGLGNRSSGRPLDTLAKEMGMAEAAQAVRWDDRYRPFPPDTGPIISGQAVLSQYPIRRHVRTPIEDSSEAVWDEMFRPDQVVQTAAIDINGWPLLIMNVDLDASDLPTREQHARMVNRIYKRLAGQGLPIILLGNIDGPPSSTNSLAGGDQPRRSDNDTVELLLRGTGLQPAFHAEGARLMGQSVATYPAEDPTRKVDYIFYRPGLIVPTEAQKQCGPPMPSDHCALALSFLLPRPVDQLPEQQIPDDRLPSLDTLIEAGPGV